MCYGPVAQWIEQLRPKEKVVRSTRTGVTTNMSDLGSQLMHETPLFIGVFLVFCVGNCWQF